MSRLKIGRGVVLNIGGDSFEVHRLLDGNRTVQLERVSTCEIRTIDATELIEGIADCSIGIESLGGFSQKDALPGPLIVASLSERQHAEWARNIKYVKAVKRQQVSSGDRRQIRRVIERVASEIGDLHPPSDSTVIRWIKRFDGQAGSDQAFLSLPLTKVRAATIDQEVRELAWTHIKKHYLKLGGESLASTHRRFSFECRRHASGQFGRFESGMSLSTFRRLAAQLSQYEIDRARRGADYASRVWRHAIGGVYATRPLERVEMDHTMLDLYVLDDHRFHVLGRPTLTMLIDSYTKYVISLYIGFEGESLGRVSRAIKLALNPAEKGRLTKAAGTTNEWMTPGIWDCLVVDNGLAFQSPQLMKIATAIGCDLEFSPVRKPWFKPTVERFMLEVARILPVEGRPNKPGSGADAPAPSKTACVTFSDLCTTLVKWVTDVLPFQIPERTLERPIDKMSEFMRTTPELIAVPGLDELELITALEKTTTVAQGGVEFMFLAYRSPELGALARRQRSPKFRTSMRCDPNNLGRIWVQDPADRSWLAVPCVNQSYANGTSLQQHRMIRKYKREKLLSSGAYESLEAARQALSNELQHSVQKGRRALKSSRQLALLEGKSSMNKPGGKLTNSEEPDTVIDVDVDQIPIFEAFSVSAKDGWETL